MTKQTTTRKEQKTVQIIARIVFTADNRKVVYLVRSSNGVDQYEVHMFDGKACSCTCPSRKPCRHMAGTEQIERIRSAPSAKAATFVEMKRVYDVRQPPTPRYCEDWSSADVPVYGPVPVSQNPSTRATDLVVESKRRECAPLAGASRAFSLMR